MSGPPQGAQVALRIPRSADLARAHRIDEHLLTLQLPLSYASVASVNAYLLDLGEGWLLFDCGSCLEPGWDGLAHALDAAGVSPRQITMLLVSHSHADHRGLAAEVIARTGARFAMGPGPHPIIDAFRDPALPLSMRMQRGREEGIPADLLQAIVGELPAGDEFYPDAQPDITLREGDRLQSACGEWEVHAYPGHSADQIGLWNQQRRWLISADLALPGAASFLEFGTRPDPHADQMASLQGAIDLQPKLLLAGHGRPAADPLAFLRECVEAMHARLHGVRDQLQKIPRSTWELAAPSMSRCGELDQWQRALIGTRCVLDHLRAEGLASCAAGEDGIWRWFSER